jgi:hypothetical protein
MPLTEIENIPYSLTIIVIVGMPGSLAKMSFNLVIPLPSSSFVECRWEILDLKVENPSANQ